MEREADATLRTFDYLVAGSGLAGLSVALRAARYGRVAIVTKSWVRESNSYYAQGGIAAVTDEGDSPEEHRADTLTAGRGLCDWDAVDVLVHEAPECIRELIESGMHFDQIDGSLALGLEGGHHHRRILHAGGDATGALVTSFLAKKVAEHPNIEIFENHVVLELLMRSGACWGLSAWDVVAGCEQLFVARHTFLTIGGTSAIYSRSTNPSTTVGDGIAIAWRAGCPIVDFEFIQFHPTALCAGTNAFLISEAVRGEGAHLINEHGERFMEGKYPLAELEPRDTVARAIANEISKGTTPYVWLDLQHLNSERILSRFPTIARHCADLGYNLAKRIPVAPAAHYMVGGVHTNLYGETGIPNLYVCGELASTGIMGANRLASNSLIECLVFGRRAVEQTRVVPKLSLPTEFAPHFTVDVARSSVYTNARSSVAAILAQHVGIVRSAQSLALAKQQLVELEADFLRQCADADREFYAHAIENLLIVARLLVEGADYRKESRGGHYRSDFPEQREEFAFHTVQERGKPISKRPVQKKPQEA